MEKSALESVSIPIPPNSIPVPEKLFSGNTISQLENSSEKGSKRRSRKKDLERTIGKDGECNFHYEQVPEQKSRYLSDLFTTLLEWRWRYTLMIFSAAYLGSWFIFAIFWYIIVYWHDDTSNMDNEDWKPCVSGIQNFTSAFLFSVETQHTTGYGFYQLTETCPIAILLFCLQSIFGVILEGLAVGLIFTKMSRAKNRSQTLMFSQNAVISPRDGQLYFMFRIGDMRKSHLLEAHVRAQLIQKRKTKEGEVITYSQKELNVGGDGEKDDRVLIFWPTTVVHKITPDSPLYDIKPEDLCPTNNNCSFEIVVVLEGIVESTGLTTQARSSYLPAEILWGHRFECMASNKSTTGERIIDYSLFNITVPCEPEEFISSS